MGNLGELLDTVIKLMNFGFAGVGVIVLLLVFAILIRGKPVDGPTLDLYKMMLRYGLGFAVLCGLLAVLGPLLKPRPVNDPPPMLLSFSPSFESEKLPDPAITLPDGNRIAAGETFTAQPGQVLVSVDDALKAVKDLKQSVRALADTATEAQQQADAAVDALTKVSDSDGAAAAAQARALDASKESQETTKAISQSVAKGDLSGLAASSRELNRSAAESFRARSAAITRAVQ